MAAGRCAGCGKTGSSCKIDGHAMECPDWLELFRTEPDRALDAAAEYRRWKADDRADERDARRELVTVQGEAARTASLSRFAYVDPLEDP